MTAGADVLPSGPGDRFLAGGELDLGGRRTFIAQGDGLFTERIGRQGMHRFTPSHRHDRSVPPAPSEHRFWIADLVSRHWPTHQGSRVLDRAAVAQSNGQPTFLAKRRMSNS